MLKTLSLIEQRNSGKSVDEFIKRELGFNGKFDYESYHIDDHDQTIIVKI